VYDWSTGLIFRGGRYFDPTLGIWLALAPLVVVQSWQGRKRKRRRGMPWYVLVLVVMSVGGMVTGCDRDEPPTPTSDPGQEEYFCYLPYIGGGPPQLPKEEEPQSPLPKPESPLPEPKEESSGKVLYLFFDDGPGWGPGQAENTESILDTLNQRGIKATFFVLGQGVNNYPATLRRINSEGHTIGSHSYDHPFFTQISDDEIRDQMTRTEEAIKNANEGSFPSNFQRIFQPPYLDRNARTDRIVEEMGYKVMIREIGRDLDSDDYQYQTQVNKGEDVEVVAGELKTTTLATIRSAKPESLSVLFHSIHSVTVKALPGILDELLNDEEVEYRFAAWGN
jgi:peptidoglycan/xylan/chitin deacetylase (PgdA/CDA1 family)